MKQLKIILFLVLLLNIKTTWSKDYSALLKSTKKEVSEINKQHLWRQNFSTSSSNKHSYVKLVNYENVDENVSYVYFDVKGKIRKLINLSSYPEGKSYAIQYFDETGLTLYTIYYETSAMEESLVGTKYLHNGTLVYTDIQLNNEDNGTSIVEESFGGELITTGKRIYDIKNLQELENYCRLIYNNKAPIFNSSYPMVLFLSPNCGEETIVNARKVNIREKPSRDSNVISVAGLGTSNNIVTIKNMTNSRNELWAQIYYEGNKIGYILSDYLEPIEIIIK